MPAGYDGAELGNPLISFGNYPHATEQAFIDDGRGGATHEKHLVILDDSAARKMNKLGPEIGRQLIV